MRRAALPRLLPLASVLLASAGCAASPPPSAPAAPRTAAPADARFVAGMIAHHAQAIRMSALIEARTTSEELRLLGERITVSQQDEIARMQQWLRARGAPVPEAGDAHAHHDADDGAMMPGMLTPAQLAELEAATGVPFEALFLERMIAHHEGALVMVRDLFATDGAAQDAELHAFALDVNADQSAEIRRMRALLARRRPTQPEARP